MNSGRRFPLLLLGVILLLATSFVACAPSATPVPGPTPTPTPTPTPSPSPIPTGYTRYWNEEYGYSFYYPSNWDLDDSNADLVKTYPPVTYAQFLHVAILAVNADPAVPVSVAASQWVETIASNAADFSLLSSEPLDDDWDWLIEYTHTLVGSEVRSQAYIKQTNDFEYAVYLTFESDSVPVEVRNILDSFSFGVVSATTTPEFSFITYKNDTHGYTISYPSDWMVEVLDSDSTRLEPPFPYFGRIEIDMGAFTDMPVETAAQIWLEVSKEVWGNLTVLDSREMQGKWDWYVSYDYVWEENDMEFRGETYFKSTEESLYRIIVDFEKANYAVYPLGEIVDTFRLLPE